MARRLYQVARQDCTPQLPRPRVLLCWVGRQERSSQDTLKSLPRLPGLQPTRAISRLDLVTCVPSTPYPSPTACSFTHRCLRLPVAKLETFRACRLPGARRQILTFQMFAKVPELWSPTRTTRKICGAALQAARKNKQTASRQPRIFLELPQKASRCRQRSCQV